MKSDRYKIINQRKLRLVQAGDFFLNVGRKLGLVSGITNPPPLSNLKEEIKRILIIRLAYIGDVVMTQPVTAPLREIFPYARIDFLTSRSAAPLLRGDQSIDNVIEFDAPWFYGEDAGDVTRDLIEQLSGNYDLGIDFRGDVRNIWHCLYRPKIPYRLSYTSGGGGALLTHPVQWTKYTHKVEFHLDILRKAGLDVKNADPVIHFGDEELKTARQLLDEISGCTGQNPIVMHPGSRLPLKRWPEECFVELIKRLNENDMGPVVLVEAPGNEKLSAEIASQVHVAADLAGKLTIREMAAVFHHARVLVCHDSAPMHIAAASGCRVVALFGPSRSMETAPCGEGHHVIEVACPLKDRCDENVCWHDDGVGCMSGIQVDEVFGALSDSPG